MVNELYSRARKLLVVGAKNKIGSPLKKNPTKSYSKPKHDNNGPEGRKKPNNLKNKKKQSEEDIIKGIKDKIIRAIKNFFQRGEDYCNNK